MDIVTHAHCFQADSLVQDALEILGLARSLKNSLAPVNRISSDVLPLLPDYCNDEYRADELLIDCTHVCRSWREILISRPSLWTNLTFKDVKKTRTYIQRSGSSPLNIFLHTRGTPYRKKAFSLVIPHICQLRSLAIHTNAPPDPDVLSHFHCPAPLLEKLDINIFQHSPKPNGAKFDGALFNGELPSLRELSLSGVITDLAWKNMKNLTVFTLSNGEAYEHYEAYEVTVTQILDFFESAPFLQRVDFDNPTPDSSDAPPGRVVPMRHLKTLDLSTYPPISVILNHLHIPTGASLKLWDHVKCEEFSPLDFLPDKSPNFENLSHITMVNLHLDHRTKSVRLGGPSGSICLASRLMDPPALSSATMDHKILGSIGPHRLPTIQRLAVTQYTRPPQAGVEECSVFRTLSSLDTLRTLVLSDCNNLAFILALNPEKNSSALVPCPNLEELVIYHLLHPRHEYVGDLVDMSRSRDSRGAKLSSIVIVDSLESMEEEVSKLQEHVTHVEYRCHRYRTKRPAWDDVPNERRFEEL